MGMIERKEVVFYCIGREVVCADCVKDEELIGVKEDDIVISKVPGEKLYFCDRCKKQIS